ncbi:hypothetical protein ACFY19_13795 [Streptosporangium saharense]|uniref:hypothetical protein n=1 Tax=Streptosporangium saharense TaxID=1706840 RepID=UPI00367FC975
MPRQRRHPVKNTSLRDAITAVQQPYAKLAAIINAIAAENGHNVHYSASTVAHWLAGATPRQEMVAVIVEAFARLLGRPGLAAHDLGWPQFSIGPGNPWDGDPVVWVARLGRDDVLDRRSLLTAGLYSLAALNLPPDVRPLTARPGSARRAGISDVERIRTMYVHFSSADDLFGGGHARTAVLAYLVHDVVPLLHGTTGRARPALFGAASQLTYLAAFMASDAGSAGLAQRCYIQAVRLADEAGDLIAKATALRGLALQAVELGHPAHAVDLAQAATSTLGSASPIRTHAWMSGMRAEAHAANGETAAALAALRHAERGVERADSAAESESTGAYQRAALEHQTGLILTHLTDLPAAERHLLDSIGARRDGERRSRVLIASRLAALQLRQRNPDAAAATVLELRDDLKLLTSGRITGELARLRHLWSGHRTIPGVDQADRLIASLLLNTA